MLTIHRAERTDALAAALGDLLSDTGADPFSREVVAVPSHGVERWLAQQLSHRLGAVHGDGVCANVIFPLVTQLLDDAVAATDARFAASQQAWAPERSVWKLMSVIDSCVSEPPFRVLASHLGLAQDRSRRFAVASKLARHFTAYGSARPHMLTAWAAGRDEQGDGIPLPDDLVWQADLWRRLRAELGVRSPAELSEEACRDLAAPGLPQRWSVFGPTRMSPARIAVLAALAEHHDVHLWLAHPSPAMWDAVRALTPQPGLRRTAATPVRHQLLASMARDVSELQTLLLARAPEANDEHHPGSPRPATLLGRLQQELAADTTPAERGPVDGSLTVHACHGRARQVEVLREAILGVLAQDPTLEPRDIVIMCPDIETFAPLVAATFGMADEPGGHPAATLRVKLADRSLQQTNPLLSLLAQILQLARSRVTATGLLDLAGTAAVRRAFGFDDDDVERLRDWTVAAGARWGLDADHRSPYGLDRFAQGTWRSALDRILLGVTMEERGFTIGDTLPLDDVDSGDIDLAGRFAELVDRVEHAVREMAGDHTVRKWAVLLRDTVLALGEGEHAWQMTQLRSELDDVAESAADAAVQLGIGDIANLLGQRLAGRPTRASFRTGTLTVCTLVPMRSVPHRVVCLLGMDDGAFPRQGISDGDDVLARAPRTGERDVRSEDRQLFLDAILAAQEQLIVTYTGNDPRSGAEVPPCVPLGELLDAIDATAAAPGGGRARDSLVLRHPLQPFDRRNFSPGELGRGRTSFSFDPVALAGARAAAGDRRPARPLVATPLSAMAASEVALDDLLRFLQHPARAFLRQRLQVSTAAREDEPENDLAVELDSLQKWGVGDRALRRMISGMPARQISRLEELGGRLPPGRLGAAVLREVGPKAQMLVDSCRAELALPAAAIAIRILLPDGRALTGTVPGVRGRDLLTLVYSSLAAKHRLTAWVQYLALTAGSSQDGLRAITVGRDRGGVRRTELSGVEPEQARLLLTGLAQLRDRGLCAPLPMALATSAEYADRRSRGMTVENAVNAARRSWESREFDPENKQAEHVLLYGGTVPLERLLGDPPHADEHDLAPGEPSRFAALARALWQPLLDHERVVE